MKRLSINDIAKASLRTGKRAYLSLAIGIFLSIFLVTSLFMTANGIGLARTEKFHRQFGSQDLILFSAVHSPEEIMESGLHEKIGVVSLIGRIRDSEWMVAWYDEAAAEIRNRHFIAGGLPERPGEIAVEQQVLDNQRIEAEVGDIITLTITPIDGADEERTFILSGIMVNPDDGTIGHYYSGAERIERFPSLIVHPEEKLASGRIDRQYLLTMKKGQSRDDALIYWTNRGESAAAQMLSGYLTFGPTGEGLERYLNEVSVSLYIIAIALIAACCVGISQALESVLTRRVDQIGMLRAVGATRRQIRKIFGREAWLLAAILAPLSVALGCAFVWVLSRILPDAVKFDMELSILLPILLVSALFILLAAGLPLRRASQILPMGVIRDTAMLRKVRGLKSRKTFTAPNLIAGRQIRLHWSRQIGAALMVMMMLVITGVAGGLARRDMGSYWDEAGEYEIYFNNPHNETFVDVVPAASLNQADIKLLASIEHVEKIRYDRTLYINLNIEGEVPEYFKQHLVNASNDHMEAMFDENSDGKKIGLEEHANALSAFGKTGTLVQLRLQIIPEEEFGRLIGNVAEGKIDLEAINAGREVLAYAPDIYREYFASERTGVGSYSYEAEDYYTTPENGYEFFMANDAFFAGQELSLVYAWITELFDRQSADEAWTVAQYEALDAVEAEPTIGALLDGIVENTQSGIFSTPCLITTEQGAQAMGLPLLGMNGMEVYLDGEVDRETEDYLTGRLESIARRGDLRTFWNNMEFARENREFQRQLLLSMLAAITVFFASSFSMISGSVKRRIRADERMIGTLRAVGADKRTVIWCYLTQTALTVLLGFVMAAAVCLAILMMNPGLMTLKQCALVGLVMLGVAAACFGLCMASVHKAVGEVMKRSVVENIREL